MGEVLTTMKIMPDSPDVDLEAIKSATLKPFKDDNEREAYIKE